MKDNRIFSTFIIVVFSLSMNQDIWGQNLQIEIFNKTGFDLDSISMCDKYVGNIQKNHSIVIKDCTNLSIQDRLPYGLPDGIIKNKKHNVGLLGLCATGRRDVSTGNYKFDITLDETEDGYRLFWNYHK